MTPSRRRSDPAKRPAGVVRTVAIRWFLPAIPWAGLVGVVAVHFALTPPAALLTALVGFAIVGVFGLFGLQARRHGIAPTRLVVELTEREAVEDMDRLRHALGSLRRHGVRIAADDVGAGNAGLRLISEVTFDVLKIDLTLVRAGAVRNPTDGVLRALRDLAGRRSQSIVAEGVETAEDSPS